MERASCTDVRTPDGRYVRASSLMRDIRVRLIPRPPAQLGDVDTALTLNPAATPPAPPARPPEP